jgi:uncharacterized membrane protein YfcA
VLFGVGGLAGMYFGARFQKRLPAAWLKLLLGLLVLFVALRYAAEYLLA